MGQIDPLEEELRDLCIYIFVCLYICIYVTVCLEICVFIYLGVYILVRILCLTKGWEGANGGIRGGNWEIFLFRETNLQTCSSSICLQMSAQVL